MTTPSRVWIEGFVYGVTSAWLGTVIVWAVLP